MTCFFVNYFPAIEMRFYSFFSFLSLGGKERFEPVHLGFPLPFILYPYSLTMQYLSPQEHCKRNSGTWRDKHDPVCLLGLQVQEAGAWSKPLFTHN
jgi:hypothetical protein